MYNQLCLFSIEVETVSKYLVWQNPYIIIQAVGYHMRQIQYIQHDFVLAAEWLAVLIDTHKRNLTTYSLSFMGLDNTRYFINIIEHNVILLVLFYISYEISWGFSKALDGFQGIITQN